MSSHKRPWYKWWPKDFNQDEKVKGLGWDAELVYRRVLDVMWQSNDCRLPNDENYIYNAVAIAIPKERFAIAWLQIQRENFELFLEKDGWIYSKRLTLELEEVTKLSEIRKKLGKKGGKAKAKAIGKQKPYQNGSDTDIDADIDKDKQSGQTPSHFQFKVGDLLKDILKQCEIIKKLKQKDGIFNSYTWVQTQTNISQHPQAILDSLKGLISYWHKVKNPWTYANSIIKTKSQNYNEKDFISQQEQFKKEFNINPEVKNLLGNIGEDI